MTTVSGGQVVVRISGQDVGLSALLQRIQQQMQNTTGVTRTYATSINQLGAQLKRSQAEKAQYASTLARVAAAMGDTAGATRILVQALRQVSPATQAAANLQLQLQQLLNQTSGAARNQASALDLLKSGLSSLGVAFAASTVTNFVKDAIEAGNELEKLTTTFRVLSGSQQAYEDNLATAKDQQAKFGGSLQDTVEGLSSFANLSKRTGVNLQELTNFARALAIVDPVQGFKGAGIALKELFSGNITSLARRFEIPKEVLNRINEITDSREKFAALTQELEAFGISTELLTSQMGTTAVTFDKLEGNAEDLKANLGQLFATISQPFAEKLASGIAQTNQQLTNLSYVFDQATKAAQFNQAIFAKTDSYDTYLAKINEANTLLPFYAASVVALTPAQYEFAQSLIATGVSAEQAFSTVAQAAPIINDITERFAATPGVVAQGAEAMNAFANSALQVAVTSAEGAAFVQGLSEQVLSGAITLQEGQIALAQWAAGAQNAAVQAAGYGDVLLDMHERHTALTKAVDDLVIAELADNQAKEAAKIQTDGLKNVLNALMNGTINQTQAEGILANNYGVTASQLPGLISLTLALAAARKADADAQFAITKAAAGPVKPGEDAREARQQAIDYRRQLNEARQAEARAAAAARRDQILAVGTQQQQLALRQSEYDAAVKLHGVNSKAAVDAQTALILEQQQAEKAAKAGGRGGGGGTAPKLTANEKLGNSLQAQQDKFNNKFEDAEQKHYEKLADIYEDFNKKQQEQFAKNEVSKRRSRADFYSGLQDAEGIDVTAFAAAYEEAFAKAQEIAASGKAVLANEFLELRTKQIEEMKQLAEEEAKIRSEQQEGKISPEDAASQLEFLEGRRKLIEDAQREEQQQLLAAGDANQNALQEQLTAEQQAYEENTGKIITAADRAAEAKIKNAQRSKIAVSDENKALAEQNALYDKIAAKTGGVVPPSITQGQTKASLPADAAQDKPIDIQATAPIPITPTDILLVRQAEMFIVHDTDVIVSIGDLAARLEGKFVEMIGALNIAKDSLVTAVGSVENAVRNIRINNGNVLAQ